MARDVRHPYKTADEEWDRQVADNLARDARQGIPLVVMNKPNVKPTLLWYLYRHKSAFQWQDEADWKALAENSGEIWCYHHTLAPIPPEQYPLFQPRSSGPWTLTHHERHTSQPDYDDDPIEHWEIFHWKKGSREE